MPPALQAAFHLLVTAAQQARLTANEHIAVDRAAQAVQQALQPPAAPAEAASGEVPPA